MKADEFTRDAPGRLVPTIDGCMAFYPNPLPPKIDWEKIILPLSDADRALCQADGMTSRLISPSLIVQPLQRREAVISSRMEGTYATDEELVLFSADPKISPRDEVREVINYVAALEFGLRRMKELPLSLRLMRELHATLLKGTRGEEEAKGEFRRSQNYIGAGTRELKDARYIPPPVPEMQKALGEFEKSMASPPRNVPILVEAALLHYQFEAIHPFRDGNGRLGRLLITLWLCAQKYLNTPILYMSDYFEKNKKAYVDGLLDVSRRTEWEPWITFFLLGIREQSLDATERIRRLLDLRESYRERLKRARSSALTIKLVDELFKRPITSMREASILLGITPAAAKRHVDRLVDIGVLEEVTGRKSFRFYLAKEVLGITKAS